MKELAKYNIQFLKLAKGSHTYEYQLDRSFFDCFENARIAESNINAQVTLHKEQEHIFDIDISIDGAAKVTCDRCLDPFSLPLKSSFNLMVKLTEEEREDEDDITYLPFSAYEINMANYLYDICLLAMPMQLKCEDSGNKTCNETILEKLDELDRNNQEPNSDPRWDELKKLIKTEKK